MDRIVLIGLNHTTAPVEIREKFAAVCLDRQTPLQGLARLPQIKEAFYLSTCNRMEVLFTTPNFDQGTAAVVGLLADIYGQTSGALKPYLYTYIDQEAVKHLFRVTCSLDSMVVGEPQILGQVKQAYREAVTAKTTGVILNRLLHKSFSVAKQVRTETRIGRSAVSISYAAVELAKKIFNELAGKKVLLIGAGEMAELAAEHLLTNGVEQVVVANRTLERALALARRFGGTTVALEEVVEQLQRVDIIISSTGSLEPILTAEQVKSRMRGRRNRPLFFIDIAVPRDIDPAINDLDNVYLYNIDDLQGIVELNKADRLKEAGRAEHIIAAEALKFEGWLRTLEVVPTIVSLRNKAEQIRECELQKTLHHFGALSQEQINSLEVLTRAIVNKVLHDPILFLKRTSHRTHKDIYIDMARKIFNLDGDLSASFEEDEVSLDSEKTLC
ncbi:MAG: glutamyl-tRNA reductase [Deltaproteobacteria bacterium]|nr:glutamyl-tRNA reductase [Deltaproteobacteria bacterium]MBW2070172.1 glutamyl-tRNA reductase [Deltaproteobacteria bacterium]